MRTTEVLNKTITTLRTLAISCALLSGIDLNAQIICNSVPRVDQAKLWGFSGDNGLAVNAKITLPVLGAYAPNGNFYFSDNSNQRVRVVNSQSIINTFAGNGTSGFSGDNGQATNAQLSYPGGVASDLNNNIYILDNGGTRIRKIAPNGIITTIAGTGVAGFSGDNGLATAAQINGGAPGWASIIKCDGAGNIYFIDVHTGNRVRKINVSTGIITTVAGNGTTGFTGDGGLATNAQITATDFDVDNNGNIYISGGSRIRKINNAGIINTIAGTGVWGNTGDNGPAINAQIEATAITTDNNGNVYLTGSNTTIRKIDNAGIITTYIVVQGSVSNLTKIDISPASGNFIATFMQVCFIESAICELVPQSTPPPPPANVVTANNSGNMCQGGNIQLSANAQGNGSYSWSGPNGFTSNAQNPQLSNVTAAQSGAYVVTYTEGNTVLTATTNITVYPTNNLMAQTSGNVCQGGDVTLKTNTNGGNYVWYGPNGFSATNSQIKIQEASPSHSGSYTVVQVDNNGCLNKGTVDVIVYAKPNIDIEMNKAMPGCEPRLNLEFAPLSNAVKPTYNWDLGNGITSSDAMPKNLNYSKAGTYNIKVVVKDDNGCTNERTRTLEVYPSPSADFVSSYASFANPVVQFNDQSKNAKVVSWNWNFGNGAEAVSNVQNPSYTYPDSGSYNVTLKVKTDLNCESTITKKVIVFDENTLFIPDAFSPNGDGLNDVFMVSGNNITKLELMIFSRGGALIFQTNDLKKGWDGYVKGVKAESGVYVYKVNYTANGKTTTSTGNLTLLK